MEARRGWDAEAIQRPIRGRRGAVCASVLAMSPKSDKPTSPSPTTPYPALAEAESQNESQTQTPTDSETESDSDSESDPDSFISSHAGSADFWLEVRRQTGLFL